MILPISGYSPTLKISYYNLDQLISFTKPRSTNHGTALEADLPPPEVAPLPLHLAQVVVRAAVGAADRAQDHAAAGGTAGAIVGHCGSGTGVSRVNGESCTWHGSNLFYKVSHLV